MNILNKITYLNKWIKFSAKSLLLKFSILVFCTFSFSCFEILHTVQIRKNEVNGQMHLILPRKMFGQEISQGNGMTSMDQKITEMKKKQSMTSLKSFDVQQNTTESNLIISFLYSGTIRSNWKYIVPEKGEPSGFLLPYMDSSNQIIFVTHTLPNKINNQSMGSEFGESMFKQFTYKLMVASDVKPKKASLYIINEQGESKESEIPIIGESENMLYVLPIECSNGNCILILSDQLKINKTESDRIAKDIKSKLSENYQEMVRIKEERKKILAEEEKKENEKLENKSNLKDENSI